jgi:hypothetical protein
MLTSERNRRHPVMLPDDYIRKMKQALGEVEAGVEAETKYEPVVRPRSGPLRRATSESYYEPFPDDPPPPDDGC